MHAHRSYRSFTHMAMGTTAGVACAFAVLHLAAPPLAHAQPPQMVTFDVTYTVSTALPDAHYTVKPAANQPTNWRSPIDYAAGTAHFYLEVFTKPSDRPSTITVCFDGDLEAYGCTGTKLYTTTGTHVSSAAMSSTWQYSKIQWTRKRTEYHLVLKDDKNNNGGRPRELYMPSKIRLVMTIVPPGGTYTPPAGSMVPDGGAPPSGDAGAAPADAAFAMDASAASPDAAATTPDAGAPAPDAAPAVVTADAAATPAPSKPKAPTMKPDPPAEEPAEEVASQGGGGCSVGGEGAVSGGGSLLLAAAMVVALGRRRRR
jgi:MYXO-CTERM domain-containing protein